MAEIIRPWGIIPETILLANPRGQCAGVIRTVEFIEGEAIKAREEGKPGPTVVGQPIHNEYEIARLKALGVRVVEPEDLASIPQGSRTIFRAHGTPPYQFKLADELGLDWANTACPYVMTRQRIVWQRASQNGSYVIDISKRGHPEQLAVYGVAPDRVYPVEDIDQARNLQLPNDHTERGIIITNQTTLSTTETEATRSALCKIFPHAVIVDGICHATDDRQEAVRFLAKKAGKFLVVTGTRSHNGKMLGKTSWQEGTPAQLIAGWQDLSPEMYGTQVVAVTSAASTPEVLVEGVVNFFWQMGVQDIREDGLAELVERERRIRFAPVEKNPRKIF
ncbi:hypothetical protein HYS91_00445 [Candidatus Daviesbacteria bacterium]|nr:hypothetical protein [Candidatus Daviesbacteria bacterium]